MIEKIILGLLCIYLLFALIIHSRLKDGCLKKDFFKNDAIAENGQKNSVLIKQNTMNKFYDKKLINKILIIGIFISFFLLLNLEYGLYGFGKMVIFFIDIYLIYFLYTTNFLKNQIGIITLAISIIVFNPISPMHFQKPTWRIFDILSGLLLIIIYLLFNKDQPFISKIYHEYKKKVSSLFKKRK